MNCLFIFAITSLSYTDDHLPHFLSSYVQHRTHGQCIARNGWVRSVEIYFNFLAGSHRIHREGRVTRNHHHGSGQVGIGPHIWWYGTVRYHEGVTKPENRYGTGIRHFGDKLEQLALLGLCTFPAVLTVTAWQ